MSLPSTFHGEAVPATHSRRKSEMVSALADLDTNEDFWPEIVSRISEGEFVSTIATELKVNYSILRNWIRGNKAREAEYQQAEQDGKQSRIQRVLKRVHETATAPVAAEVTHMEALRASEIALKQHDQERAPTQNFGDINIIFVAADNGKPKEIKGESFDQVP